MKKFLSCLLSAALVLAAFPAVVLGAEDMSLETAVLTAKEKLQIPQEYSEFESSIRSMEGLTEYHLSWSTLPDPLTGRIYGISATVNSRGDLTNYYRDQPSEDISAGFASLSGEEIRDRAKAWLTQVNPGWMAQLPDQEIEFPQTGSVFGNTDPVTFSRRINGLPFCGNQVVVWVNNHTGEIANMSASWNYETGHPDPASALSPKDAWASFAEKSPMLLSYYKVQGENRAELVYRPENAALELDAVSGELYKTYDAFDAKQSLFSGSGSGGMNADMDATDEDAAAKEAPAPVLTDQERQNIEKIDSLLPESALRGIAEGLKNTGMDKAVFTSCSYSSTKDYQDEEKTLYLANLRYEASIDGERTSMWVCLNAETGELINYNGYGNYRYLDDQSEEKATKLLSYDQALEKALAFAEAYAPDCADKAEAETPEEKEKQESYSFYLIRRENDIPYPENQLSVAVDGKTGRIESFTKNWEKDITFANPAGILSQEEASQAFFEKIGLSLSYDLTFQENSADPAPSLKYTLGSPGVPRILDAKTGEPIGYDGKTYDPDASEIVYPEDIKGHYGENAIEKLFQTGVLKMEENETAFRPDEPITLKELLAFVTGIKNGYIPYGETQDAILKRAARQGIITKAVDPDSPALREDGALFLIRALNMDVAAKVQGIYQTPFADQAEISPDKLGHVALCLGLGIISGDENGEFHPQSPLTRADAAIMMYNYLKR